MKQKFQHENKYKSDTEWPSACKVSSVRENQQNAGEEFFMRNWKKLNKSLPVYIAMMTVASACGGTAATYSNGIAGTTSTTSGITTVVASPSPTASSEYPAETFSFSVSGEGGTDPTYSTKSSNGTFISTDNLLQVTVNSGSAGELSLTTGEGYSAYTATYNCITYTVSVYDQNNNLLQSQTTETLAVTAGNSGCSSAPTSQTLNFSSTVVSGTHGGVYVTVVADEYDFYCQYWWSLYYAYQEASPWYADYNSFCPMREVYKTHTVNGSISIVTNGSGG
jgi:hypothetical protein